MTEAVLVIAWLVFAHLIADFVLQNDWIALNKGTGGRTGWSALAVHGFHVGLCLLPFVFAYGLPALVYLVLVVASHMLVDRWKVRATRRAEQAALEGARRRLAAGGGAPTSGLGRAWTAWPGMLFLADQVLHLTIALVAWLVLLEGVPLLAGWVDAVNLVLRTWDRATVHAVLLTGVVLVSLFLVNTRAAYYFVLALVSPRDLPPDEIGAAPAEDPARQTAIAVPAGAPARVAATVGALERLLIVALVLARLEVAVGFVIAAKAIARYRQLSDRGFAEYFLLGTLASVSVAFLSATIAAAALATIP